MNDENEVVVVVENPAAVAEAHTEAAVAHAEASVAIAETQAEAAVDIATVQAEAMVEQSKNDGRIEALAASIEALRADNAELRAALAAIPPVVAAVVGEIIDEEIIVEDDVIESGEAPASVVVAEALEPAIDALPEQARKRHFVSI